MKMFRFVAVVLLMIVGLGGTATAFAQPPRYHRHYPRRYHRPYYRHHYYRHR